MFITVKEEKIKQIIINAIVNRYNNKQLTIKGEPSDRWWEDTADHSKGGKICNISGYTEAAQTGPDSVEIKVNYIFNLTPRPIDD